MHPTRFGDTLTNLVPIFEPRDRVEMLDRLIALMEGDDRIDAAVVTGSIGAGRADRWSDIDVAAVVADRDWCELVASDFVSRLYQDLPVAHHYETAFGTTLVRGFLLDSALEVDLAFTPREDFVVWAPVKVIFDRAGDATHAAHSAEPWFTSADPGPEAGFAWHDIVHACAAANRGLPWRSLYYLQRVRNRTLGLALQRHGLEADEFKEVDELPQRVRDPLLATLVSDLEPAQLLSAIVVVTEAFLDELSREDAGLAARLGEPLRSLLSASAPRVGSSSPMPTADQPASDS